MIIGIMGAMPDEVDQLCARLENVTKGNYAGSIPLRLCAAWGKQVVVCCAGMGKAKPRPPDAGAVHKIRH